MHWFQAASDARASADAHAISYVDFLTVTLTALCALLAALAIIIALAAIWGYSGIKEALTKEVRESADRALRETLKGYPDAAEMIALAKRVEEVEGLRALLLLPETNGVVQASEIVEDEGEGTPPETLAQDYPDDIGS